MTKSSQPSMSILRSLALLASLAFTISSLADDTFDVPPVNPPPAIEGGLILDSVVAVRGGEKRGEAFGGKATLSLALDSEQLGLWRGGKAFVQLLGTFGEGPSPLVGDLQKTSNIEAPRDVSVFEAWLEQSLGSRASLLAGYHDYNTEFDVAELAGPLVNSSFGVGPDISQVGPSIFPATSLALRLRVEPGAGTYVLAGAYDDVPLSLDLAAEDATEGSFLAAESGWVRDENDRHVKVAAGYWRASAGGAATSGVYVLAERTFEAAQPWGVFFRSGSVLEGCHPIRGYAGAGIRLDAPFARRANDSVVLGVAHAILSSDYRRGTAGLARAETTIELTWVAQLRDWLAIQPDVQYVIAPATRAGIDDALQVGVRAVLTY